MRLRSAAHAWSSVLTTVDDRAGWLTEQAEEPKLQKKEKKMRGVNNNGASLGEAPESYLQRMHSSEKRSRSGDESGKR